METASPPQYQVQGNQGQELPSAPTSDLLDKPIVIPQLTNLRFIKFMKNLSPFARCYPHSLSTLSNPITDSEFLAFIDRLNHVFVSLPIFQVAHVTGGVLCSVQGVLPAQVIGGVLQVTSLLASAGVSLIRVRKFLKSANADTFAPRGLVCQIMTTEKMMAAIHFTEVDKKAKLKLPPLETVHDLGVSHSYSVPASISSNEIKTNSHIKSVSGVKDPHLLRLQALEGYIAPLDFNVTEPSPENWLSKMGQKPLRWANHRQIKALEKAHEKSNKTRNSKACAVSAATLDSGNTIAEIDNEIEILHHSQASFQGSGHECEELERLGTAKREEEKKNEKRVKEMYGGVDKKIEKAYKKEEKVANRILWVVITKANGTPLEEETLFRVESEIMTLEARE
ncbi:hypothetical protein B0J13DRAFT_532305 [Dactylonectria estremocensis]|uniref:Uncharacterized protein n=1 Tax=Dactylonectria estremocensis TaxID=1079267 RepID=A0A9P9II52_9HYPO|nr:hypothetical protein B0J13DRAFT_532305 [Dactylonectria estremocensis]